MANRNFSTWLSGFRDSIADYGYYIDFEKVHRNVDGIKVELNILNSLIGSKNIKEDFKALIKKYPETLKCIPLLLAVRANEIYCQDENGGYMYQFRFLYKGIIIKHNKTEPTYTKTSLFLCEKRRFFMARTEKGVVTTI